MPVTSATTTQTDPYAALNGAADAASASGDTSSTAADSAANLGNENTFLQLMVAQLKNQDPTQPVDSTTFLSQLAQFSSLEQLININKGVQTLDTTTPTDPTSQTGTSPTAASGQ
ncbi:MAG TPA: flagellar hook capping FlgD N-terminal domain-containing protein [Bryobacteraceae bacterium]|jgi:flagellar basal-body rod modification protein FlgD